MGIITNTPNLLTMSRIAVIPVIVWLLFLDGDTPRWVAVVLFTIAGITDFFDGYLARTRGELSRFGQFLDPLADKLLVSSVILMLVAFDRITGLAILPALVILMREILVSGLREFMADLRVSLPVSTMAKWKTTIQMVALGFLIVGDASPDFIPAILIGEAGIWIAAVLTLITGYDYFRSGMKHMTEADNSDVQ